MLINGNGDERWVPFDHALHVAQLGADTACARCHHQNLPFDQNTSCSRCHRDMYETTDTFDHAFHVSKTEGNLGCARCHANEPGRKTRHSAKACQECHVDMIVKDARIRAPEQGLTGFAVSYLDAMHGLCVACHKEVAERQNKPNHARCDTCHRPEIEPVDMAKLVLGETTSRPTAPPGPNGGSSDKKE
jgi:Zn finger protein HypA/HybF involved in hydrogenase expression